MGSFLSRLLGSFLSRLSGRSDAKQDQSSGIMSFNSSETWQLHFNASKESSKLMVIDFFASWCGPCKFIEPAVHEMANKFTDVQFSKIDVEELSDVAQGFKVQAMPTFVLVKNGKEVDRVIGARKDELEKKIEIYRAL